MGFVNVDLMVKIALAGILLAVGVNGWTYIRNRQQALALTPIERAMRTQIEAQGFDRELEAYIRSTNATDPQGVVAELSRRGIARLTTDQLVERSRILLNLDLRAPVELCAARFMGTMQPAQYEAYFAGIDSVSAAAWSQITASGIKAELRATDRIPRASGEEKQALFQTIYENLNETDQERWSQVLNNLERASPTDQCWMSTSMQSTAMITVEPTRSQLFRTMAKVEAGL